MDIAQKMKELADLMEYRMATDALIESLKDQIKQYMIEAGTDEISNEIGKCTYREVSTPRFATASFRADHEDLYQQYMNVTTTRRFTFN